MTWTKDKPMRFRMVDVRRRLVWLAMVWDGGRKDVRVPIPDETLVTEVKHGVFEFDPAIALPDWNEVAAA